MVQPVPDQTPAQRHAQPEVTDANEVVSRTFEVRRKGYDQDEVRGFLGTVADALADAQRREADMRSRLAKAVRRAEDALAKAEGVSAQDYSEKLGDEVTRILDATRTAAEERTARSVAEAKGIVDNARKNADEIRKEAQGVLGQRTSEAQEAARRIIDAADQAAGERTEEAEAVLERARESGLDHLQRSEDEASTLVAQAEKAREQILKDMDRRRRSMRAQVEQLKAARDRLLESHDVMREVLDTASQELRHGLIDAKVKGEAASRRVGEVRFATPDELEAEIADAAMIGTIQLPALVLREDLDHEEILGALPGAKAAPAADSASGSVAQPQVRLQRQDADSVEPDTGTADDQTAGPQGSAADPQGSAADPQDNGEAVQWADDASEADEVGEADDQTDASDDQGTRTEESDAAAAEEDTAEGSTAENSTAGNQDTAGNGTAKNSTAENQDATVVSLAEATTNVSAAVPAEAPESSSADHPAAHQAGAASIFDRLRAAADDASDAQPETHDPVTEADAEASTEDDTEEDTSGSVEEASTEKASATENTAEDEAEATADEEIVDAGAEALIAVRDAAISDLETRVSRGLKRALVDEQNVLLETSELGYSGFLVEVLPDMEHHADLFLDAVVGPLADAYAAGAAFFDADVALATPNRSLFEAAVKNLVIGPVRERLSKLNPEEDSAEVVKALRAFYRQHKVERVSEAASYLTLFAFSNGSMDAANGAPVQWLHVEHEGGCPDGHDNELSGPQAAGTMFPSGCQLPPLGPGCRCLLIQPPR